MYSFCAGCRRMGLWDLASNHRLSALIFNATPSSRLPYQRLPSLVIACPPPTLCNNFQPQCCCLVLARATSFLTWPWPVPGRRGHKTDSDEIVTDLIACKDPGPASPAILRRSISRSSRSDGHGVDGRLPLLRSTSCANRSPIAAFSLVKAGH